MDKEKSKFKDKKKESSFRKWPQKQEVKKELQLLLREEKTKGQQESQGKGGLGKTIRPLASEHSTLPSSVLPNGM